jgi:deazaflavin-dependent oxidoreductase (nitroreductase family)
LGDLLHRIIGASNALARPLAGRRWFKLWGVIHHRGRTSGRDYATPVVVRPMGGFFITPLPFGDRTQWLKNVLAAGNARVRWDGRDFEVDEPTVVTLAEAERAYGGFQHFTIVRAGIEQHLRLHIASGGPGAAV